MLQLSCAGGRIYLGSCNTFSFLRLRHLCASASSFRLCLSLVFLSIGCRQYSRGLGSFYINLVWSYILKKYRRGCGCAEVLYGTDVYCGRHPSTPVAPLLVYKPPQTNIITSGNIFVASLALRDITFRNLEVERSSEYLLAHSPLSAGLRFCCAWGA